MNGSEKEGLSIEQREKKGYYPFAKKRLVFSALKLYFEGLGSNFDFISFIEKLKEAQETEESEQLPEVEAILASPEIVKVFTDWVAELNEELGDLERRIKELEAHNENSREDEDDDFDRGMSISDVTNKVLDLEKILPFLQERKIPVPQAALGRFTDLKSRWDKL